MTDDWTGLNLLEGPESRTLTMPNTGKNVEQKEISSIPRGYAK